MEGLLSYSNAWLIYLAAGLMGWWCWYKLFFWLKVVPFTQHLAIAAGAVLVFTPAPIFFGSDLYAPAFIVTAFSIFSDGIGATIHTYFYWALSTLIAVTSLLVVYLLMFLYKLVRPNKKKESRAPKNNKTNKRRKGRR